MYKKNSGFTILTSLSFATVLALLLSIQTSIILAQENTTSSNTVNVGGNGSDWDKFLPQNVTINVGESITWIQSMSVPEPHTVTFMKDKNMLPPLLAPFSVPNSTEFTSTIPNPNVDPAVIPDPTNPNNKLVVVDNARASNTVVIDNTGTNVTYLPANASYTFTGDESYLNSGWMWPAGRVPPGAPPISSFTVTFENAGTYDYLCVIHPWMTGTVKVD